MSNVWFTADEHYHHTNIIRYCGRPFESVDHMNHELIERHNALVKPHDTCYHLGDFCFGGVARTRAITARLQGRHVFIRGSHDDWMPASEHHHETLVIKLQGQTVVLSHYAHRVWPASHHGSWHLYGHSHGKLPPWGRSMDVGVDTHDFRPWSFDEIADAIRRQDSRPDPADDLESFENLAREAM